MIKGTFSFRSFGQDSTRVSICLIHRSVTPLTSCKSRVSHSTSLIHVAKEKD